jgi:EpsI family protein
MIRRALIIAGLLIAGALYLNSASKSEPIQIRRSLSSMPIQIGNWNGERSTEFDSRTLKILGVDDYVNRQYFDSTNATISLYIGYYRSQRQGASIHSPMNCLPGAGWNPIEKNILSVPVQKIGDLQIGIIKINRILIQKGSEQQMVLYWYQSHGRVVASEYWGKIFTVIDAIRTNRTDAALVRVISPVAGMEGATETIAEQKTMDFVKSLFPLLGQYIPD